MALAWRCGAWHLPLQWKGWFRTILSLEEEIHTLRMGHLYLSVFLTNLETSSYNWDHTETVGRTPLTTVRMFIVVQLHTIILLYYVSQSWNSVSCANNFSLIISKDTFLRMWLLGKAPVPDIYTLYSLHLGDTFLVCPSAGNCIFFTQKLQKKKKNKHISHSSCHVVKGFSLYLWGDAHFLSFSHGFEKVMGKTYG